MVAIKSPVSFLNECFGGKLITLGTQTGIPDFSFIFAQDHLPAVEDAFGANVDYAMLIKTYLDPQDSDKWYSPGEIVNALPMPVTGNPKGVSDFHVILFRDSHSGLASLMDFTSPTRQVVDCVVAQDPTAPGFHAGTCVT